MSDPLPDPASGETIDAFHHRLLDDLRGFGLEPKLTDEASDLSATLRGAATLLNVRLAQGAAIEEGTAEVEEDRESTAFEHAFLRIEVERFRQEIRMLDEALRTGCRLDEERARRYLLRRIHRIEAVLELHMQAVADRTSLLPLPHALP